MDSKSIVRFVRPWVQIPPTPPKARQPPKLAGLSFCAVPILLIDWLKELEKQYTVLYN